MLHSRGRGSNPGRSETFILIYTFPPGLEGFSYTEFLTNGSFYFRYFILYILVIFMKTFKLSSLAESFRFY